MEKAPKSSHLLNFTTAGCGGMMGWMIVHPFNTLSVRMNLALATNDTFRTKKGFLPFAYQIIQKEGIKSLYSGLTAGLTRQIFYSTSVFGFFEIFRDQMSKYREIDYKSRAVAGICSGGNCINSKYLSFDSQLIFRCCCISELSSRSLLSPNVE